MYICLFFIFGLCMGSFSNVVIHRLPIMILRPESSHTFNLFFPRSHCPECQQTLSSLDLIPLFSWLFLLGKCSMCNHRISVRYPMIELAHAIVYGLLAYYIQEPFVALPLCFFINALIVIALIDYRHLLIPDMVTLPLIWAGLLWNSSQYGLVGLHDALYGAVAGYLSLWTTYWLYFAIRKREGLGYGDFKLCAALGGWLGWESINFIMLVAPIVGVFIWLVRRKSYREMALPFGPALCCGGMLYLIFMESRSGYWYTLKAFL